MRTPARRTSCAAVVESSPSMRWKMSVARNVIRWRRLTGLSGRSNYYNCCVYRRRWTHLRCDCSRERPILRVCSQLATIRYHRSPLGPARFVRNHCRIRCAETRPISCANTRATCVRTRAFQFGQKKFRFDSILATESIFFDSIRFGNLINFAACKLTLIFK